MANLVLKVLNGSQRGLSFPLHNKTEVRIGRKIGDVIIEDPLISSKHARLFQRSEGWYLQDLGSTNGTFLGGQLVKETMLPLDVDFSLGSTTLHITHQKKMSAATKTEDILEIAWLLDEELLRDDIAQNKDNPIDNALRIPPSLNALVEVISGEDQGRVFRCQTGNINIGRKIGEIPLSDQEVSRRHAIIECFGKEMIFFRDLESTNGSFHNGQKIKSARLQNGDTIAVGKTIMRFRIV